jgi:hypothetical protein
MSIAEDFSSLARQTSDGLSRAASVRGGTRFLLDLRCV